MKTLRAVARNELRLLWRSTRWYATALAVLLLALGFFPPQGAGYATFTVDGHSIAHAPGVFASAGAILANVIVSCVGFFLVGDGMWRDARVRVLETAAAAGRRYAFGIGRYLGGVAVLWTLDLLAFSVIVILALLRGGVSLGAVPAMAAVYFPLTLSLAAFVAALATGFDAWLPFSAPIRATVYIAAFFALQIVGVVFAGLPNPVAGDPIGVSLVKTSIGRSLGRTPRIAIGLLPAGRGTVHWQGIPPGSQLSLHTLWWAGCGIVLVLLLVRRRWPGHWNRGGAVGADLPAKPWRTAPHAASGQPSPRAQPSLARALAAEIWLVTRVSRWWYRIGLVILMLGAGVPLGDSRPLAAIDLVLPLLAVPQLVGRESQYGTDEVIYGIPRLRSHYVTWKSAVAISLALAPALLLMLREAVTSPDMALGLAAGLLSTALLLVAAGMLTKGPMTGIVCIGMVWYVAAWNTVPQWLDYAGLWHPRAPLSPLLWLLASLGLLVFAAARNRLPEAVVEAGKRGLRSGGRNVRGAKGA